jgi:Fe-S-cluster containining protein
MDGYVLSFVFLTSFIVNAFHHDPQISHTNTVAHKVKSSHSHYKTSRLSAGIAASSSQLDETTVTSTSNNEEWWKDGLKFGCTSCGKCCQNKGEVWLDADEFADLSIHLKESPSIVLSKYSEKTMSGWVKLKTQETEDKEDNRCIFLGADDKQCTIYESRPIQCKTYPFWPRLLSSETEWEDESVLADSVDISLKVKGGEVREGAEGGRHWTATAGGCEGLSNPEAPTINSRIIYRNNELYKMYTDAFPFNTEEVMYTDAGNDKNKLLAKTTIVTGIITATTVWVRDFMLKYQLQTHADQIFVQSGVRYRAFLGTEKKKIIEKLRYEILALLTAKEEDVSTTLLVLPFALDNFEVTVLISSLL